ncbi:hypothetical protein FK216_01745 [Moraxellaceae bacterium AER2_44_116]|nr:hypothetical protein [Moraxellaceae bacterium]TQC99996.1 hypothetical protein FK216_01745 [Moraxellaceae bacterium AER2_44_116]
MTTLTLRNVTLSLIRWTAICYLPGDDVFVSASHVVGTLFNSEAEAKQAAIAYSNTHPCIAYLVYQQAVNASKIAQDCRTTASVLSADIGRYVVGVSRV